MEYKFNNLDELIKQAIKDNACSEGIEFAKSCKDLDDCINTINKDYAHWCLYKGYIQFATDRILDQFSTNEWCWLLRYQPQFINRCDKLDQFDKDDWCLLLRDQPLLINRCDKLDQFSNYDWCRLLSNHPQLINRCDKLDQFSNYDWSCLLQSKPQLAEYYKKN